MATVKGIQINPDKTIETKTFTGLKDLQTAVQGWIEPVTLKDGTTMYVNEEGNYQFTNDDVNWIATDVAGLGGRPEFMFRQPILGPVVLVGPVNDEGESTDVTEVATRWVKRVAREAGGVWTVLEEAK